MEDARFSGQGNKFIRPEKVHNLLCAQAFQQANNQFFKDTCSENISEKGTLFSLTDKGIAKGRLAAEIRQIQPFHNIAIS